MTNHSLKLYGRSGKNNRIRYNPKNINVGFQIGWEFITWPKCAYPQHLREPSDVIAQECLCTTSFKLSAHFIITAPALTLIIQQVEPHKMMPTSPKAIETTPLLNPTTSTGVTLPDLVPSPSCRALSICMQRTSNYITKLNHLSHAIGSPTFHRPFLSNNA